MQLFRLMGMPDKVIAFNELPKEYLDGLELHDCTKMGRAWRDFIGKVERVIQIKPDLDPITRQMRTYLPIKESAPFAYLIDWEINNDKERWGQIVEYVRKTAPVTWKQGEKIVRMMDDLEKMAIPLGKDPHSELDLEPEDVIVVPLTPIIVEAAPAPAATPAQTTASAEMFPCNECEKTFDSNQGLKLHKRKKHIEAVKV